MANTSLLYKCKCGAITSFSAEEIGELKRCTACLASFMVPFESSPGISAADLSGEEPLNPAHEFRRTRASPEENLPVEFGRSILSAYRPSGRVGDLFTLVAAGLPGLLVGTGGAALCVGGSILLNLIHNVLPVFIFIFPILILGFLALAPAGFGLGMGSVIAKSVQKAKCRKPKAAGFVAFLWTCIGLALIFVLAEIVVGQEGSFIDDKLLPFVREMTAYSISFTYLEEPDPINVPAWVVFGILGLSGLLGVIAAYGLAEEKALEIPFCERCQKYMRKNTLWKISPVHALQTVAAFISLDYDAISRLPYCDFTKNRIDVEAWGCNCRREYYLELVGHGTRPPASGKGPLEQKDPVRIFSRRVSLEELNRVRQAGVLSSR